MLKTILVTDDEIIRNEILQIVYQIGEIKVDVFENFRQLHLNRIGYDYLAVLISDLDSGLQENTEYINKHLSQVSLVFYNHSLSIDNLSELADSCKVRLIIGEHRKQDLQKLLAELKSKHWRHIPLENFGIDKTALSDRIIEAVNFIETSEINECSTVNIAGHLGISPGYFSQEFKKETGISFRKFMQKVLYYYEEIILSKGSMSTKSISRILGYSEQSSFSRSFKKRKGISPSEFRKKTQEERLL
jgi:YesN/AraC family two-component response regulator